ncbi:hypothetical protein V1264_010261 [Littorina saxatilis]|uniref:Uncharacterized protein n=1 Tax=Littorina saxatilis TaxID=31220 RepID=A0AAN9G0H3_9CAEN
MKILPRVLILLPLISALSAAGNNNCSGNVCGRETAFDCMKYGQLYESLPEDMKYTECVNATKFVHCLEAMMSLCPNLEDEDKDLYLVINQGLIIFKENLECSATAILASPLTVPLTSLLLLYEFLCVIELLS